MYLHTYLEINNLTQKDFAKSIGMSRGTIYNYIQKKRLPDLIIGRKIEKITKGKVTIDEMIKWYLSK